MGVDQPERNPCSFANVRHWHESHRVSEAKSEAFTCFFRVIAVPHGPENSFNGMVSIVRLKLCGRLGAAKCLSFDFASYTRIEHSDPLAVRSTRRHSSSRISAD